MTQRYWRERAASRNYWLLIGAGVLVLSAQVAIGVAVFFPSSTRPAKPHVASPETKVAPPPVTFVNTKPMPARTPKRQFSRTESRPRYVCVASVDACRCSTVKGIPVRVSDAMCREIAAHGDVQTFAR